MLVLKRKEKQSLVLLFGGRSIKITVVKAGRGASSLAISADPDVHIVRSELLTSGNDKEVK